MVTVACSGADGTGQPTVPTLNSSNTEIITILDTVLFNNQHELIKMLAIKSSSAYVIYF